MTKANQLCRSSLLLGLLCSGLMAESVLAVESATSAVAPAGNVKAQKIFATVNGQVITIEQFNTLQSALLRKRFYHGKIPDGQGDAVRQEIADLLIERELVVEEAQKRGLKPDQQRIDLAVAGADQQFGGTPMWQERERYVADIVRGITRMDLAEQFEKLIRNGVADPTEAEIKAYYEEHADLFVEPEKLRLATILVKVEPSAGDEALQNAAKKSREIYERLLAGADFAEEATKSSDDIKTNTKGGDMGYVHRGMLPEELHLEIDKVPMGGITKPLKGLDGASVFKVIDRVPPEKRALAEVSQRAKDLLKRESQEKAWKQASAALRAAAKVEILIPLTEATASK